MSALNLSSQVNTNQFLQLLVTQLKNQDPLDPVSGTDFINQLATLTTLDNSQQLNTNFSQLLQLQQLTNGTDLIGRTVQYSQNGAQMSGTVSSLQVNNGAINLMINNNAIPLSNVTSVT